METSVILCTILLPLPLPLLLLLLLLLFIFKTPTNNLPKSYPIIGNLFSVLKNKQRFVQWTSEILLSTPNLTICLNRTFGQKSIFTANPANLQHILKSNFSNYDKGDFFKNGMRELLGDGIFNADGDKWKFQRQVASHEFSTKSLRKFIQHVVDREISDRLVPILTTAAANRTVLDFEDILRRFAFDNVCRIAFGHDPEYLSPSLPEEDFSQAFETAVHLSVERLRSIIPDFWKLKRALNVGSEKQIKIAVDKVRQVAKGIIDGKGNQQVNSGDDLLSRFMESGNLKEDFVVDIVISFIIAGKDTTSAALTWFFWLISRNPDVESQILTEIQHLKSSEMASAYEQVKDMVYTHASLCETMRLYPPVPVDGKEAMNDDVLPDGTVVKKGMRVSYHPYAMGRVEKVWGRDWAEFRPQRWLETSGGNRRFVERDAYTYPVFQAGPRICLGKEMAFIQMKRVVAGVLPLFRVVPVVGEGEEPVFVSVLTAKMKGGFPVRIETRD